MMLWLAMVAGTAQAADWEAVQARLAEVEALRSDRLVADWVPPIQESEYKAAVDGKVQTNLVSVSGVAAKKAYGVGVMDVAIGPLWAALTDDKGKVEHTRLSYAKILSGEYCMTPRRVFQYLPTPIMISDRWWVSDFQENDKLWQQTNGRVREIRWQSEEDDDRKPTTGEAAEWAKSGVPLAWTKGSWFAIDIDGEHTLLEYVTWSDPGGSLPAGPVSSFSSGGIVDTLETVAQLAKDGPGCPIR